MSSEDKFKEKLRSLIEEKDFPFEEKDWERASDYLNAKRNAGRWRRPAMILLAAGSAMLLSLFIFKSIGPDASEEVAALPPLRTKAETNFSHPDQIEKTEKPVQQLQPVVRKTIVAGEQPDVNNPAARYAPAAIWHEEPAHVWRPFRLEISFKKVEPGEGTSEESPWYGAPQQIEGADTGGNFAASDLADESVAVVNSIADNEAPQTSSAADVVQTYELPASTAEQAPPADSSLVLSLTDEDLKQDTVTEIVNAPEETTVVEDSILQKAKKHTFIAVEAGLGYHLGWQSGEKDEARGFNPLLGLHYTGPVTERVTLSFGLQYQRNGNLSAFSHSSAVTDLSFGEESQIRVITPRNLHYLGVPVRIFFVQSHSQSFGIGYTISYLLDVEADVLEYQSRAGQRSEHRSYRTRGYSDGFRTFDSQLSLLYRRHIISGFYAQGSAFIGLSDTKDNGFFGGKSAERQKGIRISFIYIPTWH